MAAMSAGIQSRNANEKCWPRRPKKQPTNRARGAGHAEKADTYARRARHTLARKKERGTSDLPKRTHILFLSL